MDINKIYLTSTACYIVQTETNQIAAYLSKNGYQLVDSEDSADAIIITTCAVTQQSADVTYQYVLDCIKKRRTDNIPVYIVGCFTRIETKNMERLLGFSKVFAIPEVKDVEKEFPGKIHFSCIHYNNFFSHPFAEKRLSDYHKQRNFKFRIISNSLSFFDFLFNKDTKFHYLFRNGHLYCPEIQRSIWPVLTAKGCVYNCSYCAVRKGRGRYTSKPYESVINEIKTGISNGYNKVLLIGDELGTYGIDLKDGTSLSALLKTFISDEYPVRIGIWYLDAFRLNAVSSIIDELAQKNKIFFLGITIQNGSKRILDLMNRHYSIEETMDVVARLSRYHNIIIATQFMVGFPTESEQDFLETYALVEKGFFDNVEIYCYSPRPGTRAAEMIDDVPLSVKEERAAKLRELAGKKSRKRFLNYILKEFRNSKQLTGEGQG